MYKPYELSIFKNNFTFDYLNVFEFSSERLWAPIWETQNTNQKPLYAVINGTAGDDFLHGTVEDDIINGLGGNDNIGGGGGVDTLNGGDGDDRFFSFGDGSTVNGGAGEDTIYVGNAGDITIDGGADDDFIELNIFRTGTINGGSGFDTVRNSDQGTNPFTPLLFTYDFSAANPTVSLLDETLNVTFTLTNVERYEVKQGSNILDLLLIGSANADTLDVSGENSDTYLISGGGDDILTGSALGYSTTFISGAGDDVINGGIGPNSFRGGLGADIIFGGASTDLLDYFNSSISTSEGVSINLATGIASGGEAQGDVFSGIENVDGSSLHDDVLIGDSANNVFRTYGGNDILSGGGGNDTLDGGVGGSDIAVYDGPDINDYLIAEIGVGTGNYLVKDVTGNSEGIDTLIGIEFIRVGSIDYDITQFSSITAPVSQFDLEDLRPARGGDGSLGFVIVDNIGGDHGFNISDAGDVNGDGLDDLLLSRPWNYANGVLRAGESYIVFTPSAGFAASFDLANLNGMNGFTFQGNVQSGRSGSSISAAGDINGDGIDDIIISATEIGNSQGRTYVVFGSTTPFAAQINPSDLDGTNGFALNGIANNDRSGTSVSGAGDVNGDGIDDLIIGAPFAESASGLFDGGEIYIVFGSNTEFAASIELSALDGSNGFTLANFMIGGEVGRDVSAAGDVNGDGIDDIFIGGLANNIQQEISYVVFGSNTGFSATVDLATLDGTNGFTIFGIDQVDLGRSIASVSDAGDVNGDGIDDIILGETIFNFVSNPVGTGISYVIFGKTTGFAANFDLTDLFAINGGDGSLGFVIEGITAGDKSGATVSGAGDVNGDGFDDLLVLSSKANPFGSSLNSSGEAYIIFGSSAGFSPNVSLSSLNGIDGFVINRAVNGGGAQIYFIVESVSRAGDVNGDGFDDIFVGGSTIDSSTAITRSRTNFVIYGSADLGRFSTSLTEGNDVHTVPTQGVIIHALGGNDTINGAISDDVIFGEAGNDRLFGDAGDDMLFGGAGSDTLFGGIGADVLDGGDDFDTVDYREAASRVALDLTTGGTVGEAAGDTFFSIERVYGSDFNDTITGTAANEFFYGEDGNDTINGGGGIDRIYGDNGNDVQRGDAGNDTLYGSDGADQLNGGTGFDIANYQAASTGINANMATGGTGGDANGDTYFGIEAIYGSDFADTMTGNTSTNELRGFDGDDTLDGGGGNDRLFGGAGADALIGGTGVDIAMYTVATAGVTLDLATGGTGGEANGDTYAGIEWVFGSNFDDNITGDGAGNRLTGNDGNDILNGAGGNDRLLGGDGSDTIDGGDGVDSIFGQAGDDILSGGAGNDFFFGDAGADSHDGGADTDTVSYLPSSAGVTVNMQTGGTGGDAAGDTYTSIERIFGSGFDDSLTGSNGNDTLLGNGGADYLAGGLGNDSLNGGAGVDSFGYNTGADAADVISGFTTNETIYILGGDTAFDTFAEIMAVASDAGANTIFNFGGGNTLTVVGHNMAALSAANFDFSGTPPAAETPPQDKIAEVLANTPLPDTAGDQVGDDHIDMGTSDAHIDMLA